MAVRRAVGIERGEHVGKPGTAEGFERGQALARQLKGEFGFDFVGISLVPKSTDEPMLSWQCVAGNTNTRYQRILLPAGVGAVGVTFEQRRPMLVENVDADIAQGELYQYPIVAAEGLWSFLTLPLLDEAGVIELVCLCAYRTPRAFPDALVERIRTFAQERTGLTPAPTPCFTPPKGEVPSSYTQVTHRIIQAQEAERKRIARELHDGISQELLLAQIELRKLKYLPDGEEQRLGIERASDKLRAIMNHVSALASDLRPAALDELGLAAAIQAHCVKLERGFGVTMTAELDADVSGLGPDTQTALYRIFQEAAMNACKYSRSETIDVILGRENGNVVLQVQDNGDGFDTAHPAIRGGGLGLEGMNERAAAIGGTWSICSQPGKGTTVRVELPEEGGTR